MPKTSAEAPHPRRWREGWDPRGHMALIQQTPSTGSHRHIGCESVSLTKARDVGGYLHKRIVSGHNLWFPDIGGWLLATGSLACLGEQPWPVK